MLGQPHGQEGAADFVPSLGALNSCRVPSEAAGHLTPGQGAEIVAGICSRGQLASADDVRGFERLQGQWDATFLGALTVKGSEVVFDELPNAGCLKRADDGGLYLGSCRANLGDLDLTDSREGALCSLTWTLGEGPVEVFTWTRIEGLGKQLRAVVKTGGVRPRRLEQVMISSDSEDQEDMEPSDGDDVSTLRIKLNAAMDGCSRQDLLLSWFHELAEELDETLRGQLEEHSLLQEKHDETCSRLELSEQHLLETEIHISHLNCLLREEVQEVADMQALHAEELARLSFQVDEFALQAALDLNEEEDDTLNAKIISQRAEDLHLQAETLEAKHQEEITPVEPEWVESMKQQYGELFRAQLRSSFRRLIEEYEIGCLRCDSVMQWLEMQDWLINNEKVHVQKAKDRVLCLADSLAPCEPETEEPELVESHIGGWEAPKAALREASDVLTQVMGACEKMGAALHSLQQDVDSWSSSDREALEEALRKDCAFEQGLNLFHTSPTLVASKAPVGQQRETCQPLYNGPEAMKELIAKIGLELDKPSFQDGPRLKDHYVKGRRRAHLVEVTRAEMQSALAW